MNDILSWGIDLVLWLQQAHPVLDLPFKTLTRLGGTGFFILILPLIYWCLDRHLGARLSVVFLLSAWGNALAKVCAAQPRPFAYDDRVLRLVNSGAHGHGFPSGHTQNTVVFWGYLAACLKRRWFTILAVVFMILIPLSRMYLGVHFPTDLLGGYVLGALFLGLFVPFEPRVSAWIKSRGLAVQLVLATVLPGLLIIIFPNHDMYGIMVSAVLLGLSIGFVFERRYIAFDTAGPWWQRALRYVLGAAILIILWKGLKYAFFDLEPALLWRVVRYAIVGLWASLGAPWCFVQLHLAEREK